jgi:hypothetical protein
MTAQSSPAVALEPCPFCQRSPWADVAEANDYCGRRSVAVHCSNGDCGARGPECWTEAEAIAAWNRRAAPRTPATNEADIMRAALVELRKRGGRAVDMELVRDALTEAHKARSALPPSSGWEAGAEAMREKAAACADALRCGRSDPHTPNNPSIEYADDVAGYIRALPLPPPPSKEGAGPQDTAPIAP